MPQVPVCVSVIDATDVTVVLFVRDADGGVAQFANATLAADKSQSLRACRTLDASRILDGSVTIVATAADAAGNVPAEPATASFVLDRQPPVMTSQLIVNAAGTDSHSACVTAHDVTVCNATNGAAFEIVCSSSAASTSSSSLLGSACHMEVTPVCFVHL